MSNRMIIIVGILLVNAVFIPISLGETTAEQSSEELSKNDVVLEKSIERRGTKYRLRVNTSNHTVSIYAKHFADNRTKSGYSVSLNERSVIGKTWEAGPGESTKSTQNLIYKYKANVVTRNITFGTYGAQESVSYNFTVPRKYDGKYLRPTVTDIEFERINRTHGRVSVTLRSDSKWYHPMYFQIWTPSVSAEYIPLDRENGQNITTGSIIIPVEKDAPLEGEIRTRSGYLNESGPLHTQIEFYGKPGNVQFERVPWEPIKLVRVSEYEYNNESSTDNSRTILSDEMFKPVLGGFSVLFLGIIIIAILVANRRQRP